ncbi:MAG TPA: hypothetical protein PK002_11145 [Cellvibrio sp.]|nr:hypothetical protein [Cellvibrio sp.]
MSTLITVSDADELAIEELLTTTAELLLELTALLDELELLEETLELDKLLATLDEELLLTTAVELLVTGGVLEPPPPPPQAESSRPNVKVEYNLILRMLMLTPLFLFRDDVVNYTISFIRLYTSCFRGSVRIYLCGLISGLFFLGKKKPHCCGFLVFWSGIELAFHLLKLFTLCFFYVLENKEH